MSGHVVLVEPSGHGGIGHYTCQLAEGLSTAGALVHLHSSVGWNLLPNPSYPVRRIFRRWGANPLTLLRTILSERRGGLSVVHWQSATHPQRLYMLQHAWRPKGQCKWVYTVHNVLPHETQAEDVQRLHRLYDAADGLIFHAKASRTRFVENFPTLSDRPYAIIPHGHYGFLAPWAENSVPLDRRRSVILFFGTIRPYKGLLELLEAMAEVHKRCPDARLLIVGRPLEPWETYQQTIDRLELGPVIQTRLGYISEAEVPTVLAQARLVCLPYRDIDQSGVLLLAMSAGLPVVASRVGGIGEVVSEGETGLLYTQGDCTGLTEALCSLLTDDEKLLRMGARAREAAETSCAWDEIASKTINFYSELGADVTLG